MAHLVGEIDGSDFAITFAERKQEIERLAYGQTIPGMTREEVQAELHEVLWKAWSTYDPRRGTTLGQWWWALWIRRKGDLIAAFFAQRNPAPHMADREDLTAILGEVAAAMDPFLTLDDLCPSQVPIERAVWTLLINGFTGVEVRKMLHLSWRKFYRIIDSWRVEEVHQMLVE